MKKNDKNAGQNKPKVSLFARSEYNMVLLKYLIKLDFTEFEKFFWKEIDVIIRYGKVRIWEEYKDKRRVFSRREVADFYIEWLQHTFELFLREKRNGNEELIHPYVLPTIRDEINEEQYLLCVEKLKKLQSLPMRDADGNTIHFPKYWTYETCAELFEALRHEGFIAEDSDFNSWQYILGRPEKEDTGIKRIVWIGKQMEVVALIDMLFVQMTTKKKMKAANVWTITAECFTKRYKTGNIRLLKADDLRKYYERVDAEKYPLLYDIITHIARTDML